MHMNNRFFRLTALCTLIAMSAMRSGADEIVYKNDFQTSELGTVPDEFLVLDGDFEVGEEDGNHFFVLPGAPLESFGFLFGPAKKDGLEIHTRIFGTRKGRRWPTFAVALNGVNGYKLQLTPAKRSIELFKSSGVVAKTAHRWPSGKWTNLKLRVTRSGDSQWVIEGKVWLDGEKEPAKPSVVFTETTEPKNGKPCIWGSPYSGTQIRYDDIVVKQLRE